MSKQGDQNRRTWSNNKSKLSTKASYESSNEENNKGKQLPIIELMPGAKHIAQKVYLQRNYLLFEFTKLYQQIRTKPNKSFAYSALASQQIRRLI